MDAPARFSFDRGVPAAQYDEMVRRGSIAKGGRTGTTFVSSGVDEEFYKPIAQYEGIHRYDPYFEWEPQEEKKVVRKVDKRICTWVCLMFFALQLDRGNITQALSDNMLDDLKLTTNDYNYGQTIFFLSFLCAELPSQLISKKLGPDRWIPIQMVAWSLVAAMQALLSGRSSFYACRALLGLIEGGFIPDNILYLSYFYTGTELPKRLSFFWVSYQGTNIIAAFLAFGILRLRGHNGMGGWRWLFAIEGTITGIIGIISYFYLPPSPTQTASKFRGKDGWFNEHEEKIMVNRILRDDPSKGDMHNRQALSIKAIGRCLGDYHMWPLYLIGLSWLIPNNPMQAYLTLQLRSVGFKTFETNLLTIPAYTLFILQLLFWTWLSERWNERFLTAMVSQIWTLPILIALAVLPKTTGPWVKWALSCLLVGHPYMHAILVAMGSRNAGTVRTRTVASALYNMSVQASSIIASNIYRNDDKPLYRRGNRVLIGICVYNIFVFVGAKLYYVHVNVKRDKSWNAKTSEERQHYLATTTDKGNKRLDFRFAH
ncbi:MFS general substrate transporter [Cucurbitaria berberidis CBS 394.84]|uniref:MFS general substrate transporter n=1 Tax=Cucurbitaria berberidis CBS 394.84 TaxID=1168544 RepID=A0A9P4GGJ1_9PLEO|nr:MFS general substrate transporter [Cucurbitaria berberidis CBS 394.84]KAF1844765.1 MFS general substrate transporter [Cucurbitaria berberidis CBS 394.84]